MLGRDRARSRQFIYLMYRLVDKSLIIVGFNTFNIDAIYVMIQTAICLANYISILFPFLFFNRILLQLISLVIIECFLFEF